MNARKRTPKPEPEVVVEPYPEWLTPAEAAEFLGVHPRTLANYADRGLVATHRLTVAGHRRYRLADLYALREE